MKEDPREVFMIYMPRKQVLELTERIMQEKFPPSKELDELFNSIEALAKELQALKRPRDPSSTRWKATRTQGVHHSSMGVAMNYEKCWQSLLS